MNHESSVLICDNAGVHHGPNPKEMQMIVHHGRTLKKDRDFILGTCNKYMISFYCKRLIAMAVTIHVRWYEIFARRSRTANLGAVGCGHRADIGGDVCPRMGGNIFASQVARPCGSLVRSCNWGPGGGSVSFGAGSFWH